MAEVERLLSRKDSHVRVEDDRIVLSPLEAGSRPASATALADQITERLPRVELSDLLIRDYQDLYRRPTHPVLGLSRTSCKIGSPTSAIWRSQLTAACVISD